jgi:hypothetical protein
MAASVAICPNPGTRGFEHPDTDFESVGAGGAVIGEGGFRRSRRLSAGLSFSGGAPTAPFPD